MKLLIEIGDEYRWTREELEALNDKAQEQVRKGNLGLEYSSGYLAATHDITESMEARYAALRHSGESDVAEGNSLASVRGIRG